MTKILVTGAGGFIGFHASKYLLARGDEVVGVDNLNDYYDVALKEARLALLQKISKFRFCKLDLADRERTARLFADERPEAVLHLAAQAGSPLFADQPPRLRGRESRCLCQHTRRLSAEPTPSISCLLPPVRSMAPIERCLFRSRTRPIIL